MHYIHPAARPLERDYFQETDAQHARLREQAPAVPVTMPEDGMSPWMITRYDGVRAALADPRLFKDLRKVSPVSGTRLFANNMLNTDPPDHERLRKLVAAAFTMRRVERLRPRIAEITAGLLSAMEGQDEVDLIDAFAFPLPVTVICELLGIPVRDRDQFRTWTADVLTDTSTAAQAQAARASMSEYFKTLMSVRRQAPADDLVTALIQARDHEERLSEEELLAMLFLLLVAGHETTVNLIASGTLALLTHPSSLARLRADPSRLPSAVEELLRFTSPVSHGTFRMTACPVVVERVIIPEHRPVWALISSANRDPARFPDPDQLDLDRDTSGHLAFGHGIHYCLGAPLARLEAEIAFGQLLARFPDLSLAVPPSSLVWRESSLIHSLATLPVRLRP
jgi:cytochrome P450